MNQISSLKNDHKRLIYVKIPHPITNKGVILRDQRLTRRGETHMYFDTYVHAWQAWQA